LLCEFYLGLQQQSSSVVLSSIDSVYLHRRQLVAWLRSFASTKEQSAQSSEALRRAVWCNIVQVGKGSSFWG